MQQITPHEVNTKLANGAILIDIREPSETAREYIEDSEKWPLSFMPNQKPDVKRKQELIFFCKSGARTQMNAQKLDASFPNRSYIMQGGISGWRGAKFPTIKDKNAPGIAFNRNYIIFGAIFIYAAYHLLK